MANGKLKFWHIILGIAVVIVTCIILPLHTAYINANEAKLGIVELRPKVNENSACVRVLKNDISYIKDTVKAINKKL